MGKSRYQSGGAGYNSPERYIENVNQQEFTKQIGGVDNLNSMDLNAVAGQVITYLERIAQGAQVTDTRMTEMVSAIENAVLSAPNSQQGAKAGMDMITKLVSVEAPLLKAMQANIPYLQKGNNPIKDVSSSVSKQSVLLEQGMLRELSSLNKAMNGMQEMFGELNNNLLEQGNQEEDLFDSLKNTIINSALRSPTATAIGQLGAGLINSSLLKVAGSDWAPDWLKKTAMSAVYLEVPQSLINIIGDIFTHVISWKIANAVGKSTLTAMSKVPATLAGTLGKQGAVGALAGNAGKAGAVGGNLVKSIGGLAGMLNPVGLAITAAVVAIGAIVAGIMAHRNKMKKMDARIDSDPHLSEEAKLNAKVRAHGRSGKTAGIWSGLIAGAATGAVLGGPIGALAGAVIGGIGGAFAGKAIGERTPKKNLEEYKANMLKDRGYNNGIVSEQATLVEAIYRMETALNNNVKSQDRFIEEMKTQKRMGFWEMFSGGTDNGGARDRGAGPLSTFMSQNQAQQNVNEYLKGNPNLVHMGSLGLAGTIDKGNSVPLTTRENASNIQFLDAFLQSKGYKVSYTSNMGGAHKGGTRSHASGNKMDFQLFDPITGKPMKLRPEDAAILQSMGYWGAGTGALGWEPVKGQVGGGHYDVHTGGQIDKAAQERYLAGLIDKADRDAFEKAMANKPKVSPNNTDEVVSLAKKGNITNSIMPQPTGNTVTPDNSGMGDYTNLVQQNATQNLMNRGS